MLNPELFWNPTPFFGDYIVQENLLNEKFILVDIGCIGGLSIRWERLEPLLEVHYIDAQEQALESCKPVNTNVETKHFHHFAMGSADGQVAFFHNPSDPYQSGVTTAHLDSEHTKTVPVRSLDSLYSGGVIPRADFIKIDCEEYEPEVLRGGQRFLADAQLLGIELESSLNVSSWSIIPSIATAVALVSPRGFIMHNFCFERRPTPELRSALIDREDKLGESNIRPEDLMGFGRPVTMNLLFGRNLFAPENIPPVFAAMPTCDFSPSVDQVIK